MNDDMTTEVKQRTTSIRRPENKRRIQFKKLGNSLWYEGEVVKVGSLKEKNKLECNVKLDNEDVVKVDFGDGIQWRYKPHYPRTPDDPWEL